MGDLSTADPIATALAWLQGHASVLAQFGSVTHVSGLNEPLYPHLVVTPSGGGTDRDGVWLVAPEVQIETWGDPDGSPGRAELRRLHYVAVMALKELPRRAHTTATTVVTAVAPTSSAVWSPDPLGQPRWLGTFSLSLHPAVA